jgi:hypothetical protein
MRATPVPFPSRLRSTAVAVPALALVGALLLAPGSASPAAGSPVAVTEPRPTTHFQISSFNLLGAAHTAPDGNKPSYASGARRMRWSLRILDEGGVDVVGFQEMERSQYERFRYLRGSSFGIYPDQSVGHTGRPNSIAWRLADWSLVSATTMTVPYLRGRLVEQPVVLLRNVQTRRRAWFLNTHNPADVRGPAQHLRDEAVRIQIAVVNRLRAETPFLPVFFTGDMNDREEFFCPVTARTELLAANGGSNVGGVCTLPRPSKIDWIMGTHEVTFSDYLARDDALVDRTTDHPVIMATASIPPRRVALQMAR